MAQPSLYTTVLEADGTENGDDDDDDNGRSSFSARPVSGSCSCLLCATVFLDACSHWLHLNAERISRLSFSSSAFLEEHRRKVCSVCGFVYANRWKFCRRSQGAGRPRCRGVMVLPSESKWASKMASLESSPHAAKHVSSHMIGAEECLGNSCISVDLTKDAQVLEDITLVPADPALEGVKAAAQHACPSCLPESDTFQATMTEYLLFRSHPFVIYRNEFDLFFQKS